jgi:hypothetical protein
MSGFVGCGSVEFERLAARQLDVDEIALGGVDADYALKADERALFEDLFETPLYELAVERCPVVELDVLVQPNLEGQAVGRPCRIVGHAARRPAIPADAEQGLRDEIADDSAGAGRGEACLGAGDTNPEGDGIALGVDGVGTAGDR